MGPWRIGASGLERRLEPVGYVFRKPPHRETIDSAPVREDDFLVPSTYFANVLMHQPLRKGAHVLVKTHPGEQVEWAALDVVQHEVRHKGQTEWVGWQATLPPDARVRIRRGTQELWSGKL